MKTFCHHQITVFYFELNFKLKLDQKSCNFKIQEEIQSTWKKFSKNNGHPELMIIL